MKKNQPKIGIIGLGTFGKCWRKWLSTSFLPIETYSLNSPESTCNSTEELVKKTDVIFLCVPINKIENVLQEIAPFLNASHLIADVCSVKIKPAEWMVNILPKNVKILATHPMFGPQSAATSLKDLNFMYSKIRCKDDDIVWLMDFLSKNKVKTVEMSAEEHDLKAAKTQALSFFIGHALNRIDLPKTKIDTTQYQILSNFSKQICEDTPELFNDILKYNPYAQKVLKNFLHKSDKLYKEKFGKE